MERQVRLHGGLADQSAAVVGRRKQQAEKDAGGRDAFNDLL